MSGDTIRALCISVLIFCTAFVFGVLVQHATESNGGHIEYHGKRVDMVQAAANGAAQCGGYLIIDKDDGEALVGGCDR